MQVKPIYEFGPFRLDPQERLLLREGRKVILRSKLFDVLVALVENSGRRLTNEELKTAGWPKSYAVDKTIQVTIGELRKALAEGQNGNSYIETANGGGYRFIAPVRKVEPQVPIQERPVKQPAQPQDETLSHSDSGIAAPVLPAVPRRPGFRRPWLVVAVAFALLALLAAYVIPPAPPRVTGYTTITRENNMVGPPLTDGVRLYFNERVGKKSFIATVPIGKSEPVLLNTPLNRPMLLGVFPNGESLLVSDGWPRGTLWRLPLPTGSPQPLGKSDGVVALSPDGRSYLHFPFPDARILQVTDFETGATRTIFSSPSSQVYAPAWSPDSTKVCFTRLDPEAEHGSDVFSIWSIDRDGSHLRNMVPGRTGLTSYFYCGWTPDGAYFVYSGVANGKSDLWAIPQSSSFTFFHRGPFRLTDNPVEFYDPTISPDGKKIFALGRLQQGELLRYDAKARALLPFMNGISIANMDISRDGQWAAYVKFPERTLWVSRVDGSDPRQLTFAPLIADSPYFSPDGSQIAYRSSLPGQVQKIFLLPRQGGVPQELLPADREEEGIATWSPDGKSLTFGRLRYHPEEIDITIVDVATRQISTVPQSKGLWTPRWSHDGRHLLALTADSVSFNSRSLVIFDFHRKAWKKLLDSAIEEPVWSPDDEYIYFVDATTAERVLRRVRVRDGRLEQVANLAGFVYLNTWLGMTPDGSPLMSRNIGNIEIYALDVRW